MTDCQLGDAYQDEKRAQVIEDLGDSIWPSEQGDYLSYVKSLKKRWPHLELLVDFMEVGTIPTRWCIFPGEKQNENEPPRYTYPVDITERRFTQTRRKSKINAALLQYNSIGTLSITRFQSQSENFKDAAKRVRNTVGKDKFNLFVVEDLSREVIEILGSTFGVDPRFFRSHITEYVWNNTRDRWRDPPVLGIDAQRRNWFQMRLMRSRYFANQDELHKAEREMNEFNIMRRIIADQNHIFWDKDPRPSSYWWSKGYTPLGTKPVDAKIGHIRSRATFWLCDKLPVGILLLEPTPKVGYPLWRGYGNWDDMPGLHDKQPKQHDDRDIPPSLKTKGSSNTMSWFEEYIFWAQRSSFLERPSNITDSPPRHVPIRCLLHLVCGEWLTFADYLNTRLNQIDWGIAKPSFFPNTDSRKQSLRKLHFWRRSVPQARDMLQGSIRQAFQLNRFPDIPLIAKPYERDYNTIMERLNEYESRIDRLSSAVNSAISLDDARSTSNLTALAAFFIPLSLVATLLSMNTDSLTGLYPALKWWAIFSTTTIVLLFGTISAVTGEEWKQKRKGVFPSNFRSRGIRNTSAV